MRKIEKWISLFIVSVMVLLLTACGKKPIEPEHFQSVVESMGYYNYTEDDSGEYAEKIILAQKRYSDTAILGVILDYYRDKKEAKESFEEIEALLLEAKEEGNLQGSVEASKDGKRITVNGILSQPLLEQASIPASFNLYVVYVLKDDTILRVISYENDTDRIEEAERTVKELGF